uniref:Uncharacterized protein n=1 Tax=Caenorhabditis tropicalis TaxID=1561998 RepID=A0A1I7TZX7_9PELO
MYLPKPQKQCDCHVNDPPPWTGEVHGLSQALMSKTLRMRIFWWIVILICISLGAFTTLLIIIEYIQGPTATSTTIRLVNSLEFPAITICPKVPDSFNITGIRGDIKESLPEISDETADDLLEYFVAGSGLENMNDVTFFNRTYLSHLNNYYKVWSEGYSVDGFFEIIQCTPGCNRWDYQTSVQQSQTLSPFVDYTFNLEASFNDLQYEYVKEVYTTSIPGFMSQIGGQFGFFLGLSIITLIQMVLYGFHSAFMFAKKHIQRKFPFCKIHPSDDYPRSTMTFDDPTTNIYPPEKSISKEHIATLSRRVIATTPPSPVSTIIDSVDLPPHWGLRNIDRERENPLFVNNNNKQ